MAISVVMPALEMAQETGKLLAWRKKEGESVAKGEILLEIETDKAVMEIEAPGDGVLAGIKAQPGTDVPVGQTIAWIVKPGEAPPADTSPSASGRRMTNEPSAVATTIAAAPAATPAETTRLSPKARRLASEHGIEISSVQGSGPGGAILEKDILAAIENKPATGTPAAPPALSTVARLMAERTTQSWTTVPHFFVTREVDVTTLVKVREALSTNAAQTRALRPSYTDMLVSLLAKLLRKHPLLNASWRGNGIRHNQEINIALAVAVDDGVISAVIQNADKLGLSEIANQRKELAERAHSGKLRPADVNNGTFTISNLGMYNVDAFQAIITPPQVAILAVGKIVDRVVAVEAQPAVRPIMAMTLSCDHRVVDGAKAALFLDDLAEAIRSPDGLLK